MTVGASTAGCSAKNGEPRQDAAAAALDVSKKASPSSAGPKELTSDTGSATAALVPEFFGVYAVVDQELVRLTEVREASHRKALPRQQVRSGMSQLQAARILAAKTKYRTTRFFPKPGSITSVSIADFTSGGFVVYLEAFASLHLGSSKGVGKRLVHNQLGKSGKELVQLRTRKLKDDVYQIVPAAPVPSGWYFLWVDKGTGQKGFESGYPFFVGDTPTNGGNEGGAK